MRNTKEQFIEWATECMNWNQEDIDNVTEDENDYQIINHIPNDENTIDELEKYLGK